MMATLEAVMAASVASAAMVAGVAVLAASAGSAALVATVAVVAPTAAADFVLPVMLEPGAGPPWHPITWGP